MKKLLFLITFSLGFYTLLQSPATLYAQSCAQVGQDCGAIGDGSTAIECCNPSSKGNPVSCSQPVGGKCVEQLNTAPITCKCDAKQEGTIGSGNNKFTCTDGSGKTATIGCADSNDACYNAPGTSFTIGKGTMDNNVFGNRKAATGIQCKSPTNVDAKDSGITCKCISPKIRGDANNGFRCTDKNGGQGSGPDGKPYYMHCDGDHLACIDDPKQNFMIGVQNTGSGEPWSTKVEGAGITDYDTRFKEHTALGIRCQIQPTVTPLPTLPPPPSPPCKTFGADGRCETIATAFGDVGTDPGKFITRVFGILLGISGAIALFLIIRAGYTIMTSQGKPEQVQSGRDQMISAIVGLLFLIFSFVILQVIGVDILKLPTDKGGTGGNGTATPKQSCSCMASGTCRAENGAIQGGGSCGTGLVNCCVPSQ